MGHLNKKYSNVLNNQRQTVVEDRNKNSSIAKNTEIVLQ